MYDVILAVKSKSLMQEILRLHIWGETTGFIIRETITDFEQVTAKLRVRKYDLLILENQPDNHTISLLRKIKGENLCDNIVVLSEYVDFQTVRKSFLLGVDDFLVMPLEIHHFTTLFRKIENADDGRIAAELCWKEEILSMFERVDSGIKALLDEMIFQSLSLSGNASEAMFLIGRIIDSVVMDVFEKYDWIQIYFCIDDYLASKYDTSDPEESMKRIVEEFYSLFLEFTELYPRHGESLEEVLQYILTNPERDLKQKTLSEELYMNRSHLSTIFTVQMGISFVDYVNTVKMKRAAYLLKHTKRKIIDIAGALDYKDMGYFLKRFKGKYGVTPSQYRIPENYEFQI